MNGVKIAEILQRTAINRNIDERKALARLEHMLVTQRDLIEELR